MLEVGADGAAQALLDHVVGIEILKPEPARELTADGGFAGAGQSDQGNGLISQREGTRTQSRN